MKKSSKIWMSLFLAFAMGSPSYAAAEVSTAKLGNVAEVKFNALIQTWSVNSRHTTANDQNLRLRRSELKLSGAVARFLSNAPRYILMVDPSRLIPPPHGKPVSADNMIQDFYLSYNVLPQLEISVGQFKTPTMAESIDSSVDLPLPERSVVTRAFGYRREMGGKIAYRTSQWNASSMISSGRSLTTPGKGMFHELDMRAEITAVKNLTMGSFIVLGNDFDYSKKGRWGVNARYNWRSTVLRSEFAHGKDGSLHSYGMTNEVGQWITQNLEPVTRFEFFSPDQGFKGLSKAETLGVNYYLRDYNAKLQVAGTIMQNLSAVNGSPTVAKGVHNKLVTLVLQASI